MSLPLTAMHFARLKHADQRRKYTNAPYTDHLAEVAGIVATVGPGYYHPLATLQEMIAVAWLHDTREDTNTTAEELRRTFGPVVAGGVLLLSDLEEGNRATRKGLARKRLADAPAWVQTIKCADIISNTSSIRQHDASFAGLYVAECRLLMQVMTVAHPALRRIALEVLE